MDDAQCFSIEDSAEQHTSLRVLSIFVILAGGSLGAMIPIISKRIQQRRGNRQVGRGTYILEQFFTAAKYFGSGVIMATALIHLLQPANKSLSSPCINSSWQDYPYAFGICLAVIYLTLMIELISHRGHDSMADTEPDKELGCFPNSYREFDSITIGSVGPSSSSHLVDHEKKDSSTATLPVPPTPDMSSALGSIMFLEFGILFHSVFVGLTLAVSGETEFTTLFIVLVFHQTFEGLGLGTRVAQIQWPQSKTWVEWVLVLAFGMSAPAAIAIGLGVRKLYSANSPTALITQGIFDSISAGILIYTALVELIANEFLHKPEMTKAGPRKVIFCYLSMVAGAGMMAILGAWV